MPASEDFRNSKEKRQHIDILISSNITLISHRNRQFERLNKLMVIKL